MGAEGKQVDMATGRVLAVEWSAHMSWARGDAGDGDSVRFTWSDDAASRSISEGCSCGEKNSWLLSTSMGLEGESEVSESGIEREDERLGVRWEREDLGVD